MGMSIDEAIKHAEEVGNGCNECAAEHRQLAEWLKKLQKIEQLVSDYEEYKWERIDVKDIREIIDGNDG